MKQKKELVLYYNTMKNNIMGIWELEDLFALAEFENSYTRVSTSKTPYNIPDHFKVMINPKIKNHIKKVIKHELEIAKIQSEIRKTNSELHEIMKIDYPSMNLLMSDIRRELDTNGVLVRSYTIGLEGEITIAAEKELGRPCSLLKREFDCEHGLNCSEDELYKAHAPAKKSKTAFSQLKRLKFLNISNGWEGTDKGSLYVYTEYTFSFKLTKKNKEELKQELLQIAEILRH